MLRTAQALAADSVAIVVYDDLGALPHFNPDEDTEQPPPAVRDLRMAIREADGMLLSVPEYAGHPHVTTLADHACGGGVGPGR